MRKILLIHFLELKKMKRDQTVWFICLFASFLLLLMNVFHYFSIEEQLKMIQDFSLGFMNLMAFFLAVYYPILLIKNEFKEKTILFLLSKPVSRSEIIIGKMLSVWMIQEFFA